VNAQLYIEVFFAKKACHMAYEWVAIALASVVLAIIAVYIAFIVARCCMRPVVVSSSSGTVSRNAPIGRVFIDLPTGETIEVMATVTGRRFSVCAADEVCSICIDRPANARLRFCGHVVCVECASLIGDRCPFCRALLECRR